MFKLFGKKPCEIRPVVLLVLDGFGLAPPSEGNAIFKAKTPNFDRMLGMYPHAELIASGESVGLPANEVGNTEVGHLTMGAGRVMDQPLVRIQKSVKDGSFYNNKTLLGAVEWARQKNSKLHLMGIASTGNVHASLEHLYALIELVRQQKLYAYLHLFLDGRDATPQEGVEVIAHVKERLEMTSTGEIASLSGRYYAMDRDRRWERTQETYEAITEGKGVVGADPVEAMRQSYAAGITDEFVKPTVIVRDGKPVATVNDNDAVVFYNFRVDRPKQLTAAFVVPHFEGLRNFNFTGTSEEKSVVEFEGTFVRNKKPQNVYFVTMTEYQEGMPVTEVAFAPQIVTDSLPDWLSRYQLRQLQMAESEKERFVTYYFNGLHETFPGVEVVIVPSPKVPTYDIKPEMSVFALVKQIKKRLSVCKYHFMLVNFANPDMVAHSGNIVATIKAIEHVDVAIGQVEEAVLAAKGLLMITADHGNAEELLTFPQDAYFYTSESGGVNTEHSNNKVPVIFIAPELVNRGMKLQGGALADIAPTILSYLNLQVPEGMTGKDLLAEIKSQT